MGSVAKGERELVLLKVMELFLEGHSVDDIALAVNRKRAQVQADLRDPRVTKKIKEFKEATMEVVSARLAVVQDEVIDSMLDIVRTSGEEKNVISAGKVVLAQAPSVEQRKVIIHKLDPETTAALKSAMSEAEYVDAEFESAPEGIGAPKDPDHSRRGDEDGNSSEGEGFPLLSQ